MVKIEYAGKYYKSYQKLIKTNPGYIQEVSERTQWFKYNQADTCLRNHPLHKNLEGRFAFSITDDIRIVYRWRGKRTAQFLDVGSHKEVYKRSP